MIIMTHDVKELQLRPHLNERVPSISFKTNNPNECFASPSATKWVSLVLMVLFTLKAVNIKGINRRRNHTCSV